MRFLEKVASKEQIQLEGSTLKIFFLCYFALATPSFLCLVGEVLPIHFLVQKVNLSVEVKC